jgi:hypothetical protein
MREFVTAICNSLLMIKCKKINKSLKLLFAFLMMTSPIAHAQERKAPVLVELFSSQRCPACPPADQFLGILSQSEGVLALSCHVDYFGEIKGGLGKKFCTNKQGKYIEQIKRKSYFTPQMMINGHMSEIGYEKNEVNQSIDKARQENVDEILIAPHKEGVFNFSIPLKQLSAPANLWMAIYQKPRTFKNGKKIITYYNVVSEIIPLGNWGGSSINRAVFPLIDEQSAGFAIIAQDNASGKVLALGNYKL